MGNVNSDNRIGIIFLERLALCMIYLKTRENNLGSIVLTGDKLFTATEIGRAHV